MIDQSRYVEGAPGFVREVFGARVGLAAAYAEALATDGVTRGLIGPREVPILWERHLVNCALLADHLPDGARVVDVGSGAGLPGVVLAIRRPDLRVDLVEPLLRRVGFLQEIVYRLGLGDMVRVIRGRADDRSVLSAAGSSEWVTARAVAPLGRLVRWCLPLLTEGGTLLALKGARAADEIARDADEIRSLGGHIEAVSPLGEDATSQIVRVVRTAPLGRRESGRAR